MPAGFRVVYRDGHREDLYVSLADRLRWEKAGTVIDETITTTVMVPLLHELYVGAHTSNGVAPLGFDAWAEQVIDLDVLEAPPDPTRPGPTPGSSANSP